MGGAGHAAAHADCGVWIFMLPPLYKYVLVVKHPSDTESRKLI